MMDGISGLCSRDTLSSTDALTLLRYLQEETTPLLTSKQPPSTEKNQPLGPRPHRTVDTSRHHHGGSTTSSHGSQRSKGNRSRELSGRRHDHSRGCVSGGRGSLSSESRASPRGEGVVLDLTNEEEFPSMTPANTRQRKTKWSSGPPRRIKPTPLQSHSHTSPSPWRSDPLPSHHHSLSEERGSLVEKNHRHSRSGPHSKSKQDQSSTSELSADNSALLQRLERRMSGREGDLDLDSRISNHSIFSLTHSSDTATNSQSPKKRDKQTVSPSPHTPPSLTSDTHPPPVTSTPITNIVHVSLERVTKATMLEQVAGLYATLITEGRVPNLTSEIHFVFQLLTLTAGRVGSQHRLVQGSDLFESVDNCVYFAVTVLNKIRRLLCQLDTTTLQLLADNPRVQTLRPELATFFTEACQNSKSETPHSAGHAPTTSRVPFREDQDSSKHFPTMRAFHAFKKQRDLFYTVFREWEGNHDNHEWSFQDTQGDKIRLLIRQYGQVCSLSHLANLFKRQLLESCRHPPLPGDLANSELAGQIKNTDPRRLRRLTERFFLPPMSGGGPCPPPSFTPTEEFFRLFITEADSHSFNQHLRDSLYTELLKLHQSCSSADGCTAVDLLQSMRGVAKFLGLLEFLPYTPSTNEPILGREHTYDFSSVLTEAKVKGHLCLTVPWIVQFLSMMDPQAIHIPQYRQLVTALMDIYRGTLTSADSPSLPQFITVTTLGWLFESPSVPSELVFDHLRDSAPSILSPPPPSDCLDRQPEALPTSVLYTCCPYLNELRSLLTEFASGLHSRPSPMRKIKPLSTSVSKPEPGPSRQLETQLRESFFRGHPPFLRQLCDVVTERVVAMAIDHCRSVILPATLPRAMSEIGVWMREKCCAGSPDQVSSHLLEPFTKEELEHQVQLVMNTTYPRLHGDLYQFIDKYCGMEPERVLRPLLADSTVQIVSSAGEVCAESARQRVSKWAEEKLAGLFREELMKSADRARRSLRSVTKNVHAQADSVRPTCDNRPHPSLSTTPTNGDQPHPLPLSTDTSSVVDHGNELVKRVKESVAGVLQLEEGSSLSGLSDAVHSLVGHLEQTAYITPLVPLPHALPLDCESMCALTVQLTVHLVGGGVLTDPHNELLLRELVQLWICMKGHRFDVPFKELLSDAAFKLYLQQDQTDVWESLAIVLTSLVTFDLVSSPLLEGLWLCRQLQLPEEAQQVFLRGAAIFLRHWYNSPSPHTDSGHPRTDSTHVHVGSAQPANISRHIHFTRLLSMAQNKLSVESVPRELLSEQLISITSLVDPLRPHHS